MKQYGLIGYPLGHSFSKKYFTQKFEKEGLAGYRYENYPLADINELATLLRSNELLGLNVTIPYKEQVLNFLHESSDAVMEIGACNCIRIDNNILSGHNTDAPAFAASIGPLLKPHHSRALVLGTGGASKAIHYALKQLGIESIAVSRDKNRSPVDYTALDEKLMSAFPVIINTSPVGTFPNADEFPAIPYQYLDSDHLLFDLVYNPAVSMFLQKGAARGATIKNGYEMLELQADKSWEIWNEVKG